MLLCPHWLGISASSQLNINEIEADLISRAPNQLHIDYLVAALLLFIPAFSYLELIFFL